MSPVPRYVFGDVELDTGRVQLLKDGAAVALEPKAFAVLQLLVERAPHVVDKAEIFAAIWKDTAVTDNALTRIVTQLRRALGDDAKDPRYIATVATRGYRLLPTARRVEGEALPAATSPAESRRGAPAASTPPRRERPFALGIVAAVVAVVALAALGAWLAGSGRAAASIRSLGDLDLAIAASLMPQQLTVGTGFDGYVAFSPDGTTIAYSSDRSGALEIYVEGLAEGSAATSLTHGAGQSIQPAWSPDGRLIAYHEMAGNGIWIVPSRGGAARKIAEVGAHPSWSPDGTRVVFQSRQPADLNPGGSFGAESTIWIADVDGRTPPRALTARGRPVGSHGMPQWLPGTGRVLFAVVAPAGVFMGASYWTVAPDTDDLRPLSTSPRLSSEFVASPDGQGVLFAARDTNALWWLPISGGGRQAGEPRPTALPATGSSLASLAMSPDGRRIAWTAGASSSGIWSAAVGPVPAADHIAVANAPVALVPASDVGRRAGNPAIAPDGRIAFIGDRGNAGNKIFLVEPGRRLRQLTTDARDHFSPFWLKGENALAVLANHGDGIGWWRLDPDTGRERLLFYLKDVVKPAGVQAQVIGPSAGQAISSDFRHLAVAYLRDGVPNLWTTQLGERGPIGPFVQRTFESVSGAFGSWSGDGSWLAYQCGRGGDTQICLIDKDGTQPARQLTHDSGTNFIGEWIGEDSVLFAAKHQAVWNVRSVARATGQVTALTAFVEPRFYVRYPRWDPANRRVVFERYETTGRVLAVQLPAVNAAQSPKHDSGR